MRCGVDTALERAAAVKRHGTPPPAASVFLRLTLTWSFFPRILNSWIIFTRKPRSDVSTEATTAADATR